MNLKKLSLLTALLFVGSLGTYYFETKKVVPMYADVPFVTDLDIDKVHSIKIENQQGVAALLEKVGSHFFINTAKNFPAENSKVNNFFDEVLNINIQKMVLDNYTESQSVQFGFDKPMAKIEILDEGRAPLINFVVGKTVEGRGNYIRNLGDKKVFITQQPLILNPSSDYFYSRSLMELNKDKITSVNKLAPDVELVKKADQKWLDTSGNVVDGKIVDLMLGEIANLSFEDFYAEDDETTKRLNFPLKIEVVEDQDRAFQINFGTDGKNTFAKVKAVADKDSHRIYSETYNALKSNWIFKLNSKVYNFLMNGFPSNKEAKMVKGKIEK